MSNKSSTTTSSVWREMTIRVTHKLDCASNKYELEIHVSFDHYNHMLQRSPISEERPAGERTKLAMKLRLRQRVGVQKAAGAHIMWVVTVAT